MLMYSLVIIIFFKCTLKVSKYNKWDAFFILEANFTVVSEFLNCEEWIKNSKYSLNFSFL